MIYDGSYHAAINYCIVDYYDWEEQDLRGGFVSDAEMAQLHAAGLAREYALFGNMQIILVWNEGERIGEGIVLQPTG